MVFTTHHVENCGRRFYQCRHNRSKLDCDFFQWADENEKDAVPLNSKLKVLIEVLTREIREDKRRQCEF